MYQVNRTYPGNPPIRVNMTDVIKQGGLYWVGQFNSRYGEMLHNNMLSMVENFASDVPPWASDDDNATYNKMDGVLWYDLSDDDSGHSLLKIQKSDEFSKDGWKRLELIISNVEPTEHAQGETWYDTRDNTFSISRNFEWEDLTVKLALDSQKLNGLESWQFLRTDVDDTAFGRLSLSHTIPRTTRTFDLGSPNSVWANVHTDNLVTNTSHSIIPRVNLQYNLGSLLNRWREVFMNTLNTNNSRSINPANNITFDLGSQTLRWRRIYTRDLYAEFSHHLIPLNTSMTLGSADRRWGNLYAARIDGSSFATLLPIDSEQNIGSVTSQWGTLHTTLIANTRTQNLRPLNNNSFDLGSDTSAYRRIFVNNLAGNLRIENDINIPIVRNGRSSAINWSGLGDTHSIYVEEIDNNETTRLVIDSRDNPDQDIVIFRQGGSGSPIKDVMEVKYSTLVVNTGNIKNKGSLEIENNNKGCRQVFNSNTNTLEFRFY